MKTDVFPDIHDIWADLKRRVNVIKVDYSKRLNETRAALFLKIHFTDNLLWLHKMANSSICMALDAQHSIWKDGCYHRLKHNAPNAL